MSRGDGVGCPRRVGSSEGGAFDESGGFGEGLGEKAELSREELWWGNVGCGGRRGGRWVRV